MRRKAHSSRVHRDTGIVLHSVIVKMTDSACQKVFISYASIDGAELAQRIQGDLRDRGYDAWIDRQRLQGGSSWTKEIETALDEADYVLALLTPGSYASEICRAEGLRSLRKGKCVIPLLAISEAEIPLYLEHAHRLDFTRAYTYAKMFDHLLEDIRTRSGVPLPERFRQTYVTAPPLPIYYVARPKALTALRDALITHGSGRHITLAAPKGMDDGGNQAPLIAVTGILGIGKTILAQSLCEDEVIQAAFPDGVIWVKGYNHLLEEITRAAEALGDSIERYTTLEAAKIRLRSYLRYKKTLIVLDGVDSTEEVRAFRSSGVHNRILFTTRHATIAEWEGAHVLRLASMTLEESIELLRKCARRDDPAFPVLAEHVGRMPLALCLAGARLSSGCASVEDLLKLDLKLPSADDLNDLRAGQHTPVDPYRYLVEPYRSIDPALDSEIDQMSDKEKFFWGKWLKLSNENN